MQVTPELPIVDGFTISASMLYLPTTFRASALAELEVLRRAKSYRARQYAVPDDLEQPIRAYDQIEYQVASLAGSYLWGLIFSVLSTSNEDLVSVAAAPGFIRIQITDACTETPLFSDYTYGTAFVGATQGTNGATRNPKLIKPNLLGQPAHLDVELYNQASVDITCQLLLLMAEPQLPPDEMERLLRAQGIID